MKRQIVRKEKPVAVVEEKAKKGSRYFAAASTNLEFINTGCQVLDCVLGGGYVLGRVTNIVGDKSTGKTLLAIEACANFASMYPKGHIRYNEAEAAFDLEYAEALGLPIGRVQFEEGCFTVEEFYKSLERSIDESNKSGQPGLYILDSLDALSDKAETERGIDDSSYGAAKAKKMSESFRRLIQKVKSSKVSVIIISQVRSNIGVTFGEKNSRSGGQALDFYASQVLWLAHTGKLKRTIDGIERVVGVSIKALCKKNKVGLPFRQCDMEIKFGFGIDDLAANLEWLKSTKKLDSIGLDGDKITRFLRSLESMSDEEYKQKRDEISAAVKAAWPEIETKFLPTRSKY